MAILREQERKDSSSPLNSRSISNSNASQISPVFTLLIPLINEPQIRSMQIPAIDDDVAFPNVSIDESSNQGFDEENAPKPKKTNKKTTAAKDGTKKARKPAVYIPAYRSGNGIAFFVTCRPLGSSDYFI